MNSAGPVAEPAVMTFSQFAARGGYDVEISHDRLRFPHGISKRQARDNRKAAGHHLREAFRAAADYDAAVKAGTVRPPNDSEDRRARLWAHPDSEATRATWRLTIRQMMRNDQTISREAAAEMIIRESSAGVDCWSHELGDGDTIQAQAAARLAWMAGVPRCPATSLPPPAESRTGQLDFFKAVA